MSRETESVFKGFYEYLDRMDSAEREKMTDEQVREAFQAFLKEYNGKLPEPVTEQTAKTADDYLELAEDADTEEDALRFARKALKLEPDNLDAERMVLELSDTDPCTKIREYKRAVLRGTKQMEQQGLMDEENIGRFWGILETRPYMRLRAAYARLLGEMGMTGRAAEEAEELIRLCENDNLGIRYPLMHWYAALELEDKAAALYRQFEEREETQMLLPLSVLYFKKEDWNKAGDYLRRLAGVNKDTAKFVRAVLNDALEEHFERMQGFGYRPFTMDELLVELAENHQFFEANMVYFDWAQRQLRKKK